MSVPTGTVETFDIKGEREDLADAIYDISPTDTPLMTTIGRGRAKAVTTEWQKDQLAAADDTNAQIEGDDAPDPAFTATERLSNTTQISTKTVIVSGTADAIDKAGRKSETAYQLAKKSKELKRDMEKILCGNQSGTAGTSGDPGPGAPRKLASINAWYTTSANRETGGGGADGGYPVGGPHALKATDSNTLRAFVESQFKAVIRTAWDDGGEPTFIMVGSFNKQIMSTFTGNATRTDRSEDKRLTTAIDVYVSDFGTHKVHPNRFQRPRDVHILDPSLWEVRYLRSFRQWPLARTGDSEKRQIICEYTLCSKNEAGSGVIADLTSS